MIAQRFAAANIVMRAPEGMPECSDVHAFRGKDSEGNSATITAWRPTPEELVKIALGEPLYLVIRGQCMPPVELTTDDPFANPQPIEE